MLTCRARLLSTGCARTPTRYSIGRACALSCSRELLRLYRHHFGRGPGRSNPRVRGDAFWTVAPASPWRSSPEEMRDPGTPEGWSQSATTQPQSRCRSSPTSEPRCDFGPANPRCVFVRVRRLGAVVAIRRRSRTHDPPTAPGRHDSHLRLQPTAHPELVHRCG